MPFATNGGIRIHYEIEGAGQPLILHHGSFASGADWRDLGCRKPTIIIEADTRSCFGGQHPGRGAQRHASLTT